MPFWPAIRHQHLHHSSGSCTPLPESSTTLNDHVTPALKALHWLPIKQRIEFKLCLLVHLAINNTVNAPSPSLDPASGISCPPISKPSQTVVFLGANLNFFFIFAGMPLALTHIVLGHRSTVGDNIDSVLLYWYCIIVIYSQVSNTCGGDVWFL